MRILGILLVMGLLLGHGPARGAPADKATLSQVKQSLNRLLADLLKMKQANAKNPDATSRKRMAASIDRALARVHAALGETRGTMNPRVFTALLRALGKQPDPKKRLALLRAKIGGKLVRVEPAHKLDNGSRAVAGRIAAAALLWPRLVDVKQRPALQRAVGPKAAQAKLQQRLKFK